MSFEKLDNQELFKKYALLKLEITKLENEMRDLQPVVMQALYDLDTKKLDNELGTFQIKTTIPKTYEYSEKIKFKEAEIKDLEIELEAERKVEIEKGIAKVNLGTPKEQLAYTAPKIKEIIN